MIKIKKVGGLLLCLLLTACSKSPDTTEMFVNKEVKSTDKEITTVIYKTEEELTKIRAKIEEQINNVYTNMDEYYNFRNNITSYVDSYIKMYGKLDGVIEINNLLTSSKMIKLDQDQDGVPDLYEVFIAKTSPFRKITDERTNKNDGTIQNKIYMYSYGQTTTPILFGEVIHKNVKQGFLDLGNCILFDLLLRSNELQSIYIKILDRTGKGEYPKSFVVEGVYTPTVNGTATFYHHTKTYSETNYVVYNNTLDDYLERSNEYTRTVNELFTNTEYILVN